MRVCAICDQGEDQHHDFEPREIPDGCVCAVGTWAASIPPICSSYLGNGVQNCATCAHDKACHKGE